MSENNTDSKKKYTALLHLLFITVTIILSSAPAFRGYVSDTGESLLWCLRIDRFLPIGYVEPACLAIILLLRICIIMTAYLLFSILTKMAGGDLLEIIAGVSLFVFSPYQLYIAYDKVDLTDMLLWILILVFASVSLLIVKAVKDKKIGKIVIFTAVNICVLGGMSLSYLLSHISDSLLSFEEKGYVFGELFTSFFYRDDHPGFGIALFVAVCIWLYYSIINNRRLEIEENITEDKKKNILPIVLYVFAIIFMIFASANFPWDTIVRDIPSIGKIILSLEAPTIFLGLSSFCFTVPAVYAVCNLRKSKNEFIAKIIPALLIFFSVAVGMFLIYQYMYWQCPLNYAKM